MQQKLADVERKGGSLCVRLKEGSAFDPYIYEQIRMDETCLPPLQERKGVFDIPILIFSLIILSKRKRTASSSSFSNSC